MPTIISGSTGISGTDGTAATPAVQGTDTNTGIFFPAADTIAFAEGGVEAMRLDAAGRVLIGATTARANFLNSTTSANFQVEGTGTDGSNMAVIRNSDNANPPRFLFGKSRGSIVGSNALVQSGDILGSFVFQGNDGAEFVDGAAISAVVDAAPGTDNMPTRMTFSTATIGGSPVERMRLDSSGNLQFNSGYGSVATAFGCRAWVNFNGTGTVAIRSSGNISSITDLGTGSYRMNFTTALPDANYSSVCTASDTANWGTVVILTVVANNATEIFTLINNGTGFGDPGIVCAAFFR